MELFGATRPRAVHIGRWLRDFNWHSVRQLDAVSREAGGGTVDPHA